MSCNKIQQLISYFFFDALGRSDIASEIVGARESGWTGHAKHLLDQLKS